MSRPLERVRLVGAARQRGEAYGRRFKAQLHALLEDDLARVNILRSTPLSYAQAIERAKCASVHIERDLPDMAAELEAMAQASGLTYFDAVLLQLRRELTHVGPDCTTYAQAKSSEAPALLAQTIDLSANMADLALVLEILPERGPNAMLFTHLGLMGYMGFNSHGIAIGINMVRGGRWVEGVSPYLLVRQMLTCSSIEACLAEVARVRRTSARSLTLLQGERVVNIEMTESEHRTTFSDVSRHTNHYLHADFAKLNDVEPAFSSEARLTTLAAWTQSPIAGGRPPTWLYDHAHGPYCICMHATRSDAPGTVGAVSIEPEAGVMWACRGNPCRSEFQHFALGETLP